VRPGGRRKITTENVLNSWSPNQLVETTEQATKHLPNLGKLGFRDGTLLKSFADGVYWLISEGKRRHVTNSRVLTDLWLDEQDALIVSQDELKLHPAGQPIDSL
jgi:hypothetical protein